MTAADTPGCRSTPRSEQEISRSRSDRLPESVRSPWSDPVLPRRLEPGGLELGRDLPRRVSLPTPPGQMVHQPVIVVQLLIPAYRPDDRMVARRTAPPVDRRLDLLAVAPDLDDDPLHQQSDDLLAVRGRGLG